MIYYGFEFWGGRNTTIGTPNNRTRRLNVAGSLTAYSSRVERDEWVEAGAITSGMQGNCRTAVTAKEARGLHLGMSVEGYKEYLDVVTYVADGVP